MGGVRVPTLNTIVVGGRLVRDPDFRTIGTSRGVCKITVVNTEYLQKPGKDGKKERTLFLDCEAWEKTAEFMRDNLSKGDPVLVEGRLVEDEWVDKATGEIKKKVKVRIFSVSPLAWPDKGEGGGGGGGHDGPEEEAY